MADNINRIQSFTVNHNTLNEGIYISRVDRGIVTYDLRTRKPNSGDFMDNSTKIPHPNALPSLSDHPVSSTLTNHVNAKFFLEIIAIYFYNPL